MYSFCGHRLGCILHAVAEVCLSSLFVSLLLCPCYDQYSLGLQGHCAVVQVLLDNGADANLRGADNSTSLVHASKLNRPDIMKLLLAKGALFKGILTSTGLLSTCAALYSCQALFLPTLSRVIHRDPNFDKFVQVKQLST